MGLIIIQTVTSEILRGKDATMAAASLIADHYVRLLERTYEEDLGDTWQDIYVDLRKVNAEPVKVVSTNPEDDEEALTEEAQIIAKGLLDRLHDDLRWGNVAGVCWDVDRWATC